MPLLGSVGNPPRQAAPAVQIQRGRTSPGPEQRSAGAVGQARPPASAVRFQRTSSQAIAPGQPIPAQRQRDKFVPLPTEDSDGDVIPSSSLPATLPDHLPIREYEDIQEIPPFLSLPLGPSLYEDLPQQDGSRRGRITLYCVSESFGAPACLPPATG